MCIRYSFVTSSKRMIVPAIAASPTGRACGGALSVGLKPDRFQHASRWLLEKTSVLHGPVCAASCDDESNIGFRPCRCAREGAPMNSRRDAPWLALTLLT